MIKLFEFISNENNQLLDFLKKNQKRIIDTQNPYPTPFPQEEGVKLPSQKRGDKEGILPVLRKPYDDMFIELVSRHIINIHQCGQFVQGIRERETLFSWLYYWRDFIYEQRGAFPEHTDILPSDKTYRPAEIFLCYGHEADKQQVEGLYKELIQAGHNPWLASQDTLPSDDITLTVNQAIQRADFGLICISGEETTPSEQAQIEQLLSLQTEINIEIIIIRLADCNIPETWQSFRQIALLEDDDKAELLKAIEVLQEREQEQKPYVSVVSHVLESPSGTMHPNSKFYIEREADKECWDLLNQRKPLIFIQAPRETGKSSLLQRMLYRWQQKFNKKQVFMDFQKIPTRYFNEVKEEENFYIELCEVIGEQLNLESRVNDFWKRRNNLRNFERYLNEYILQQITNPIILAIDETERLLKSPHKVDFFGWLKSWQNQQNVNAQTSLTILLSISNEYYLEVEHPETDLLTFAPVISLTDFTAQQVHHINQQYSKPLPDKAIQAIISLVGGHPALTRLAIHKVATGYEHINDLLTNATKHEKLFGEHLKRFYSYISQQESLKAYLTQLCLGEQAKITSPEFLRLEQAGVIKKQGDDVVFRNKLYNDYFNEYLLAK